MKIYQTLLSLLARRLPKLAGAPDYIITVYPAAPDSTFFKVQLTMIIYPRWPWQISSSRCSWQWSHPRVTPTRIKSLKDPSKVSYNRRQTWLRLYQMKSQRSPRLASYLPWWKSNLKCLWIRSYLQGVYE